jgi:hypothetical protein
MSKGITEQFSKAALSEDGALEQLLCQSAGVQRQAIEQRAYQMFLEHGGTHGQDLHDWLEAERLLFGPRCF